MASRHHVVAAFTMSVCRATEAARLVGSTNQTKAEILNGKTTDCLSDAHLAPHDMPHCTSSAWRVTSWSIAYSLWSKHKFTRGRNPSQMIQRKNPAQAVPDAGAKPDTVRTVCPQVRVIAVHAMQVR